MKNHNPKRELEKQALPVLQPILILRSQIITLDLLKPL